MPAPLLKNPALYKRISDRLFQHYAARDCTLREISEATGVPQTTITRYLYGQAEGMTLHLLDALAKYFGTSVAELMEEEPCGQ